MRLHELVETSAAVGATRKRTLKTEALADCIRRLAPEERSIGVSYLAGQLPQGKIGLGYTKVYGTRDVPPATEPTLTLIEVDATFDAIKVDHGAGSAGRRMALLEATLTRATEAEQGFLRRLLVGELRQGALESQVIEGIAKAAGIDARPVRRAQMLAVDLGAVAASALEEGEAGLRAYDLRLFSPVQPMLAQTAEDAQDALTRLGPCALEVKLDGARVQVHKSGSDVRVFTRRLNDVTAAVPELVEAARQLPARELILDGETIALRPDGSPLPFQVTMKRFGRKLEVEQMRSKLPLSSFFFDCLYIDGDSLLDADGETRAAALADAVPDSMRVARTLAQTSAEATAFFRQAIALGHEGLMAKSLDATYEAGSRGAGWLKLKQAHTLDLVVIAAEWGSGRRKGWLSNLHLAARDPASGGFVMLGKTFKGLTDQLLKWQTEQLLARKTSEEGHVVHVRPELVVEIALSDVQTSPQYPAGLALRFARVKQYRPDKAPEDADTLDAVRALHVPS